MAKGLRSKTKRAFRRVKRETGVFAAADAARLHRLSTKLRAKLGTDKEGDNINIVKDGAESMETEEGTLTKDVSTEGVTKKISTSGRRLSRRDTWRLSKGKDLQRKNAEKMNRLGGVAAKRKAGRSKRRR